MFLGVSNFGIVLFSQSKFLKFVKYDKLSVLKSSLVPDIMLVLAVYALCEFYYILLFDLDHSATV